MSNRKDREAAWDAVKEVCALYMRKWQEIDPRERMHLYEGVEVFMRLNMEISSSFRQTLMESLNPLPQGEIVNPHVQEHVAEPLREWTMNLG